MSLFDFFKRRKQEKERVERLKKIIVFVKPGSKVYHTKYKCTHIAGSGKSISLYQAKRLGLQECKKCKDIIL